MIFSKYLCAQASKAISLIKIILLHKIVLSIKLDNGYEIITGIMFLFF